MLIRARLWQRLPHRGYAGAPTGQVLRLFSPNAVARHPLPNKALPLGLQAAWFSGATNLLQQHTGGDSGMSPTQLSQEIGLLVHRLLQQPAREGRLANLVELVVSEAQSFDDEVVLRCADSLCKVKENGRHDRFWHALSRAGIGHAEKLSWFLPNLVL